MKKIILILLILPMFAEAQISIQAATGWTDLHYNHHNGFDPIYISFEGTYSNKIGQVDYRQAFYLDTTFTLIETVAVHKWILQRNKFKLSAGVAAELEFKRIRIYPEVSGYFPRANNTFFFGRFAWYEYKNNHLSANLFHGKLGFEAGGGFMFKRKK